MRITAPSTPCLTTILKIRMSLLRPPCRVGMKQLDRTQFDTVLPLVAAEIKDVRMLSRIVKESKDLLNLPRLPTIITLDKSRRGVLLNEKFTDPETAFAELSHTTQTLFREAGYAMQAHALTLGYDFWTADQILHAVLPPDLDDIPSGFAQVGHIAHMNLRDCFLPYKHLIGEVILDKTGGSVQTVVHKLDSINSQFRTFDMEVVAGEPRFDVEQLESGCRFRFDFRKVYWNSRLHTEHDRLVQLFGRGNAICDPMAGVGPFAIPAAKNGNIVFANDLNPASYTAMKENVVLNKVNPKALPTYNEDAREFIQSSVKRLHELRDRVGEVVVMTNAKYTRNSENATKKARPAPVAVPKHFSHYVMNLPASAIEFLDAFRGLYNGLDSDLPLPMIHVHCFFKFDPFEKEPGMDEVAKSIAQRVSRALGYEMTPTTISLHNVRRVAPTKDMYEVSFELPREVAYASECCI